MLFVVWASFSANNRNADLFFQRNKLIYGVSATLSVLSPASGIRTHFHHLVKGLTELSAGKAQLGLGHSYSRAKVKFNVNRSDNMIIQSISLLDQLDKDINTFSMRIR